MKKHLRILAMLLAAVLCLGMLAACSNNTGETSNPPVNDTQPAGNEATTDTPEGSDSPSVTIPEANFKLGCVLYNLTDAVPVNIKNMLEAYCEMLHVELMVVQGNGAEGNLQAIENLIAADVDGIFLHSAEGLDAYLPVLEEAEVPFVFGSTKAMTDSAKELVANSKMFLGQVSFDDVEVMRLLTDAVLEAGATEIGLIAPTNVTPNYLGIRKQAVMDIVEKYNADNNANVVLREGTGTSYFDFAGFTSSLLANYPNLEYYITVTTGDSAYQPILLAEREGQVKLYAANRTDAAEAAMADGTLQAYVAGTEHIAAEFLIMYNYMMGKPLSTDGYVDLTSPALYIDSVDKYNDFNTYYNGKVLYDAEFLLGIDSLDKLEAMVNAATLENFVSGEYLNIG